MARGRKRSVRSTATTTPPARAAILAAAMAVFSKHGIAATRVEDLLLAAGIARRTFYKYFTSKEDVLAALYEITTGELVRAIEAVQSRDPSSPMAGIHHGIDTFLDFHRNVRGLRELIELALRSDSLLAARRRWMRDELVRILDAAVTSLDGRRLEPFVFYALVSALEGLSLQILDTGAKPADIERARATIHALVDHVFAVPHARPLPLRSKPDRRGRATVSGGRR